MKHNKPLYVLVIIISLMVLTVNNANSQNCKGFDKKCPSAPKEFKKSSVSRSVAIRKMKKVVINQIFYSDRTYQISVCGKSRLGKIQYRLLSDDEHRTVLYDNAIDNFKPSKLFEIQSTIKVIVEITAPHYFDESTSECAGVRIFYKLSN